VRQDLDIALRCLLPYTSSVGLYYGVCYHTHCQQSCAPARTCTATHLSQPPRTLASAATHLRGGLALRRLLPHTSSAGSRSGLCCHTDSRWSRSPVCTHTSTPPSWPPCTPASAATHLCGGFALQHLLPHTSLAGSHSGVCSHTHSRWSRTLICTRTSTPPSWPPCALASAATHLQSWLALKHLLPHTFMAGSRSSVCCHIPPWQAHALAFAAAHIPGGLALWHIPAPPLLHLGVRTLWRVLPHTFSVGSCSGVCWHTPSRRSCIPACTCTCTAPFRPLCAPASATTHLCSGLVLQRLLLHRFSVVSHS